MKSKQADYAAEAQAPQGSNVNREARRRQYLLFTSACAFVAILVLSISWIAGSGKSLPDLTAKPRLLVPGAGVSPAELWRQSAEQDIQVLEESERRLRTSLVKMEERLENIVAEIDQARIAEQEAAFEREVLLLATMEPPLIQSPPDLGANESSEVPPLEQLPFGISLVRVGDIPDFAPDSEAQIALSPPDVPLSKLAQAKPSLDPADYVPGGSFMPAVILGGMDAPTGAVSRDNPHPVLLRITDTARLPNLARRDLRECFVLAAGYGDISSERALLRTERMSCQRPDGTFFDEAVRGFIVGEDGRAGVRGKLVTKQGQILQRSLLAGIGAGFGEIFRTRYAQQLRASTTAITQGNSDDTGPEVGSYVAAGAASGASTALGRLADYYIALADRIHPVIEIGAGRTVDIVLQEGINLGMKPQEL